MWGTGIEPEEREEEENELMELREALRRKPGLRTLFSTAKNATEEDLLKAVKIIEMFKGEDE